MGILAGDVKLVASQVMDDVDNGGGAPTSNVIADGASNSIFNDISELDRAGGRVNFRKVFASIQTPTVDGYYGGNVIVADPPDDPRVAVTIFKTGNVFDRREDAANRVEAYLNKGSLWEGFLFENHITGQRSIQLFQREGSPLPPVGKTLYLGMNEGTGTEYSQYVRVTRVSAEVRTFTYSQSGNYTGLQGERGDVRAFRRPALRLPRFAPGSHFPAGNGQDPRARHPCRQRREVLRRGCHRFASRHR